jgi:two-component system, cell cycle sensor histidine kinase PleC
MFSTIRNITVAVFAVLIILTLLLSMYFKHIFVDDVLKTSVGQQLQELSVVYSKQVWNRYLPVIKFIQDQPPGEWNSYSQYLAFISETKDFLNAKGLLKTIIYNTSGVVLFDSDQEVKLVEKNSYLGSFFGSVNPSSLQNILKSKAIDSAVLPDISVQQGSSNKKASIIRIHIPVLVNSPAQGADASAPVMNAILEFNYDITDSARSVDFIQYSLVITLTLCLLFILISIIIGSKKAEHFFEKQQELSVELVAARSSAEADSKSKSQFLANVTHELRTPLNAIIGFSEIISSEAMGPINNEQYKEFIKDIHTSGVHLLSLINDILDFSKAEANKLDVILEDLDLTKIATICLRMVSTRAEEAKVKLKEELPAEHILVKLDSKRVKQVILNLLSNAVKFTAENGDVTLKIGKNIELKEVLIQVRDTGIGMAPQDLARALAPFGQIDSKLSRKREGTGLGLPLTKKLVELMQGKFDIKSEVGIGTTVTLTFPLVLADIANSTPPPPTVKTTPTVS